MGVVFNPITGEFDIVKDKASEIKIALGSGSPTVDQVQEYFDNTGSSGYFTGGVISDGGSGTINISSGEGFIRESADDNAPLLSFKFDGVTGLAIPINTTRYVFVDDAGNISLNASEFTETVDNIMIGVATNEGDTVIHAFNLGVRLEESIGQMGRYIRRVDDIQRDKRKGGLIFGQSGDANRDVTMTQGSLWWGRTEYLITAFDTSGADTFETYSAAGQEATGVSQFPNEQYDDSIEGLKDMGNNKWAVLWFYIEPDDHIVMIYGRDQYVTEGQAEDELPPSSSVPNRISAASTIAAKFIFQKGEDIASKVESAFGTPFTSAGVTDHGNLAGLADDDHTQYHTDGRADTWLAANHETTYNHSDIATNTTHGGLTNNPHSVTPTQLSLVIGVNVQSWDEILDNTTASYTTTLDTKLDGIEALAEVNNISDANATDLTDGGDTTLHDHDGIDENTSARHTQDTDTALGSGCVAADHGTPATDEVVNISYGTGSPPTANTTTEGSLFVKYIP